MLIHVDQRQQALIHLGQNSPLSLQFFKKKWGQVSIQWLADWQAMDFPIEILNDHLVWKAVLMPLNSHFLQAHSVFQGDLWLFDSLDSTNDFLAQQKVTRAVAIAEHQSKGQGRGHKHWHSPAGANLYLSIMIPLLHDFPRSLLSIMAAVLVCDALIKEGIPEQNLTLKWPNDIWLEGKKLAGVLMTCLPDRLIMGTGVNIAMPQGAEDFTEQAWTQWTHYLPAQEALRERLVAHLIESFSDCFESSGKQEDYVARFMKRDHWIGKMVTLSQGNKCYEGIHDGLDSLGCLRLKIKDTIHVLTDGTLRLID